MICVGLILAMDIEYGRGVLRGVKSYARPKKNWRFHIGLPELKEIEALRSWKADGVIAHIGEQNLMRPLQALGVPVVNVTHTFEPSPEPRVGLDNEAVGRMAAEHFLERGLTNFAFLGYGGYSYMQERQRGFAHAVEEAGYSCINLSDPSQVAPMGTGYWGIDEHQIVPWLNALPKPIGILAGRDQYGLQLAELCQQNGFHVPEDVAIVGVDNDELVCELSTPPLSSIAGAAERTGYEAAAILDRMMRGEPAPPKPVLLQPTGLVARQSSDILKVEDNDVLSAVRYIRDHIDQPISVIDVLNELYISRSSLERKFRSILGRTPLDEIRRVRIEKVKSLLATTELTVREIARRTGFRSQERLATTFRAEVGVVPSIYRQRFRHHHHA